MTQAKPLSADQKLTQDFGIAYGGMIAAVGLFVGATGVSGLCALFAAGAIGLTAAATGAGYVGMAASGLWCCIKGTQKMAQVFSNSGKSWAERDFDAAQAHEEPFTVRSVPREEFNPKAVKDVKIMRPLKLGPKAQQKPGLF